MTHASASPSSFLSTLAGRYYFAPEIYLLEQQRLFSHLWVCVGRAEDISLSGRYRVVTVGGESIIVVCDQHGVQRAFFNVCRHRGTRLCTQESGQLKGSIQCPYHAWAYRLDGTLIRIPNLAADASCHMDNRNLLPVALDVWEGLLWLNLSEAPSPLADQLDLLAMEEYGCGAPTSFARYQLGALQTGKTICYDVQANWKVILENFLECYHCGAVHPEFCELFPEARSGQGSSRLADHVEAFTLSGKASRPPLPSLSREDLRQAYVAVILPNVMLSFHTDHVILQLLHPLSSDHTRVQSLWLFDSEAIAAPGFDPTDTVAIGDLLNRQDWVVCEQTQLGMSSRGFQQGGVFVPCEEHLRSFCDVVLRYLGEETAGQ